jgi:PTH1 family peptidyl-tRNA hydrolase
MLINRLLDSYDAALNRSVSEALVAVIENEESTVVLAKPQTYVNESGRAVSSLVRTFGVELSNVMIAFDELDLDLGVIRMRPAGGSSGHRGMRSIINHLETQNYPRLRVGIGRPPGRRPAADYVLSNFSKSEQEILSGVLERAVLCVQDYIGEGIQFAMTACNRSEEP